MARTPGAKDANAQTPNPTVELETSDLVSLELAHTGVSTPRIGATMALQTEDLVEVKPGHTQLVARSEASVIVEPEPAPAPARTPTVVVDPIISAATPVGVRRIAPVRPRLRSVGDVEAPPPRRSNALVIVIYAIAILALVLALYERFG